MPDSSSGGATFIVEVAAGLTVLGIATWNSLLWNMIRRLKDQLDELRQESNDYRLEIQKSIITLELEKKKADEEKGK